MTVLNSRLQTFGAGSQFIVITRNAGITADTIQYYKVSDILTSAEWPKVENDWNFFKVQRIYLIFMARNLPSSTNQDPLYVNINYKAGDIEKPSIQDNTRIVFPYLIRPRILKYRVPHVSIDGVVLNAWLSRLDFLTAAENIVFSFSAPGNNTEWNVRFELGLACRGPASPQEAKVILKNKGEETDEQKVKRIKHDIRKLTKELRQLKTKMNDEEPEDDSWFEEEDEKEAEH